MDTRFSNSPVLYSIKDSDLVVSSSEVKADKKYTLRLRDLPQEDKPREKLLKYGISVLSVNDLLAIVLNTGTKKEDVLSMSQRLLKEYGEKAIVDQLDPKKLSQALDIPIVKACQLVACFELGRRFFKTSSNGLVSFRTAAEVFEYLSDMRDLPKEHLRGLYLNSHYRLIHDEVISIGSVTANIIHPREVFRPALEYSASAVILAHNHPSGDPAPSQADLDITNQIVEAGKILGIEVLDHIVVTKSEYISIINDKN
jgi:DNA repair protein RadC